MHNWRQGRPRDNGEYGKANRILHDLHTEQRHRMLFTSSPHHMNPTPEYYQHYSAFLPSTSDDDADDSPTPKTEPPPPAVSPRNFSVAPSTSKHSVHTDDPMVGAETASEEAALVSHRYEDTNRCVITYYRYRSIHPFLMHPTFPQGITISGTQQTKRFS